ncbi:MAG: hypothetical protein ACO1SV_01165 [Fimbriimonas sp.]
MTPFPVWFRYIALAVVCFLAGAAFWPIRLLAEVLLWGGVFATIGAVVTGYRKRDQDQYDLDMLRKIDEQEELRNLDVPDAFGIDQRQCLCCQQVYDVRYPACPHCEEAKRRR